MPETTTEPDSGLATTHASKSLQERMDALKGDPVAYALAQGNVTVEMDPAEIAQDIALRYLEAETAEALFEPQALTPAETLWDKPLLIRGLRLNNSRITGGLGVYGVIDAVDVETGQLLTISSGSKSVLLQLYRATKLGVLPRRLRFVPSDDKRAGGPGAYWLESA